MINHNIPRHISGDSSDPSVQSVIPSHIYVGSMHSEIPGNGFIALTHPKSAR